MNKPVFEQVTVPGESFKAFREKKIPLFQQSQERKGASFQLISFLRSSDTDTGGASAASDTEREETQEDREREMLLRQREEILGAARQEAGKIREEAFQQGLSQGLAQGLAQGLSQGREEGRKECRKEIRDRLLPLEDTLKRLINRIEQVQQIILTKQEQEIIQLCIEMARKIIHTEISQNREIILANLREGLKFVGNHKVTGIKLNPRDLDRIHQAQEEISQSFLNLDGVSLEGDPGILPGGCLIQTDLGYVDASMETQLRALDKTFSLTANNGDSQ
ncbi:MAG: FliH/SctL family protein [bacterium]